MFSEENKHFHKAKPIHFYPLKEIGELNDSLRMIGCYVENRRNSRNDLESVVYDVFFLIEPRDDGELIAEVYFGSPTKCNSLSHARKFAKNKVWQAANPGQVR